MSARRGGVVRFVMAATVAATAVSRHRLLTETRPRMAKADLRKAEMQPWREDMGKVLERAITLRGRNLQEFAAAVGRDERQCKRWMTGGERMQLDALAAVESFRGPWLQALSERFGAQVDIIVRIPRTA